MRIRDSTKRRQDMTKAFYITIPQAPKSAPDCKAVVRVATGSYYKHFYVEGIADAKAFCRHNGYTLAFVA